MVFEDLHVFMHLAEEDNLKKESQMHQGGILRYGGGGQWTGQGPMQDGENQQHKLASEMGYCADPHPPPGKTGQGGSVLVPTSIGKWEPQTEPLSGCPFPEPSAQTTGVGGGSG